MTDSTQHPARHWAATTRRDLLSTALRRDLTDLNEEYLDLGLGTEPGEDPRFCWPEPVRRCLESSDRPTRSQIAAGPFAVFELLLPTRTSGVFRARVEDGGQAGATSARERRSESFVRDALFLARRLVESDPLAVRVVLGLRDEARDWLVECRLAQLAEIAVHPGLLRPRWRFHPKLWGMLVGATRNGTTDALQWAHCTALCLIDASEADCPPPARRGPRP